jgi:hypothetical protein
MAGEMSALEKEMAELLGETAAVADVAKDVKKSAAKARRKSRDISDAVDTGAVGGKGLLAILAKEKTDAGFAELFATIGANLVHLRAIPFRATPWCDLQRCCTSRAQIRMAAGRSAVRTWRRCAPNR